MRAFFLCGLLAVFLAVAPTASADEAIRELVVVRPDGYYPPYEMMVMDRLTGFHVDLLREMGKRIGVRVTIESVPWKRALSMMKDGTADAITFISRTSERERFAYFLDGNIISYTQSGFFVLSDSIPEHPYSGDLSQLRGLTIGMLRGYAYHRDFDNADFLDKDDGARVEEQLIGKLLNRRFQVAIGSVARIRYIARKMGGADRLVFLRPYLDSQANYLGFSKIKNLEHIARKFASIAGRIQKNTRI